MYFHIFSLTLCFSTFIFIFTLYLCTFTFISMFPHYIFLTFFHIFTFIFNSKQIGTNECSAESSTNSSQFRAEDRCLFSRGTGDTALESSSSVSTIEESRPERRIDETGGTRDGPRQQRRNFCQRQYKSWEGRAGLEVVNIIC